MMPLEIIEARLRYRTETRRRASVDLHHALALDQADLAARASLADVGSRGNAVKRALILTALTAAGVPADVIAEAWNTTPEYISEWRRAALLDATGIAARIDAEAAELYPEPATATAPTAP